MRRSVTNTYLPVFSPHYRCGTLGVMVIAAFRLRVMPPWVQSNVRQSLYTEIEKHRCGVMVKEGTKEPKCPCEEPHGSQHGYP